MTELEFDISIRSNLMVQLHSPYHFLLVSNHMSISHRLAVILCKRISSQTDTHMDDASITRSPAQQSWWSLNNHIAHETEGGYKEHGELNPICPQAPIRVA